MNLRFIIIFSFILAISVTACYWGQHLDEKTNIFISDDFSIKSDNSTSYVYINNHSMNDYKNKILEELKSDLQYYNVTVVNSNNSKIDYTIDIKFVNFSETTHSEVVDDETSEYHGKTYELIDCNIEATFNLFEGKKTDNKLINTITVFAEKNEKITNNRNLGDYIFGTNKDNSEYREKLLSDDVFLTLAEKCGKRISGKTTKKISKRKK